MTSPRSTLAPFAPLFRDADPEAARQMARQAWKNARLIVLHREWLPSWPEQKQAEQLAERVHGKRGTR